MAYARFGFNQWYIYWSHNKSDTSAGQDLFILHQDIKVGTDEPCIFSHAQLKRWEREEYWNLIPGFASADRSAQMDLKRCVYEFFDDIKAKRFPGDFTIGTKVKATVDFPDVPRDTPGVVVGDYGTGVLVAWRTPDKEGHIAKLTPEEIGALPALDYRCPIRDGFDKESELELLEII